MLVNIVKHSHSERRILSDKNQKIKFIHNSFIQFLDVVVFTFIGYFVGMGWYKLTNGFAMWRNIVFGQYLIQLVIIVISVPIFKAVTRSHAIR